MKNKKGIRILLSVVTVCGVISLSACSQQSNTQDQTSVQAADQTSSPSSSDQTTIYGKVTKVDGSKITLELGTLKNGGNSGSGNFRNQGANRGNNGQQGGYSGNGNAASKGGNRKAPSGNMSNLLTYTGKSTTITISDTSVIKKRGMRGAGGAKNTQSQAPSTSSGSIGKSFSNRNAAVSGSLSDIEVGTILSVTSNSSGTLTSVMILSGSNGSGNTSGNPFSALP